MNYPFCSQFWYKWILKASDIKLCPLIKAFMYHIHITRRFDLPLKVMKLKMLKALFGESTLRGVQIRPTVGNSPARLDTGHNCNIVCSEYTTLNETIYYSNCNRSYCTQLAKPVLMKDKQAPKRLLLPQLTFLSTYGGSWSSM